MYALLCLGFCMAGYFFYRWRGSVSLYKWHRTRRSKKHSLLKLWWGFLFVTTLPAIICFWLCIAWDWKWEMMNALSAGLFGFALGGIFRFHTTMHAFEAHWPPEREDTFNPGGWRDAA
jgi:hypothetical protein